MASAAAVASSSREELASFMPVRSHTIVWKFSSASSLQHHAPMSIWESVPLESLIVGSWHEVNRLYLSETPKKNADLIAKALET